MTKLLTPQANSERENWSNFWKQAQPLIKNLELKKADQKHYFEGSSLVENIENDAYLAVGGSFIGSKVWNLFLQADFEHPELQKFYENVQSALEKNKASPRFLEYMDQLYEQIWEGIDKELFAHIFQFSGSYHSNIWNPTIMDWAKQMERNACYSPHTAPKLSEMFQKRLLLCAENATIARKYFEKMGFSCILVNGGMLRDFTPEAWSMAEVHSFLLFEKDGQERIYDPSIPMYANDRYYPHIIKIPDGVSFLEHFKQDQGFFLKGENSRLYYGNFGNDVVLEREVVV